MNASEAMTGATTAAPAGDPLVLGLRALVTLARSGPLDVARLAELHDSRAQHLARVVDELERGGLVRRLANPALVALTVRGAALVRCEPSWLN